MKVLTNRLIWGLLLIAGGIAFLLQNLGMFQFGDYFFAVIFVLAGLAFLSVTATNRESWWAVIPGTVLLGLGVLIFLGAAAPGAAENWGGPLVLGSISLAFWVIYFLQRQFWWAIIPAGVMLTLAIISGLESQFTGLETGGILFLGLGITFALLALVNAPQGRMRWPLIPAGILLLIGLIISALSTSVLNYVWAIGLILAGLYLFFFYRRPARQ